MIDLFDSPHKINEEGTGAPYLPLSRQDMVFKRDYACYRPGNRNPAVAEILDNQHAMRLLNEMLTQQIHPGPATSVKKTNIPSQ